MYPDWIYTSLHLLTPSGSQIHPFPDCLQRKAQNQVCQYSSTDAQGVHKASPQLSGYQQLVSVGENEGLFGRAILVSFPCSEGYSTHVYI